MNKNWNKPLSRKEFDNHSWVGVWKHHGIGLGYHYAKEHRLVADNDDECYERYLTHCKIMASPLFVAWTR